MSLGVSRLGRWLLLFGFAASGLLVTHARAQGTQSQRRFPGLSETNNSQLLTNLNRLTIKKDGVTELEEQLRSLREGTTRNPMERHFNVPYVPPPSTGPVLPSKAVQELLERKKNWGLTPEELGIVTGSSEYDTTTSFGEDKLNKKSSLQQFYDELNRPKSNKTDKETSTRFKDNNSLDSNFKNRQNFRNDIESVDDANLPANIREKAKSLERIVTQDPDGILNTIKTRGTFDNFFGANENTAAAENLRGPKTSMESFVDQFKRVLQGSSPGVGLDPGLTSLLPESKGRRPLSAYPALQPLTPSTSHELTDTGPRSSTTIVNHSTVPDFNSTLLNQWNPLYTPPKVELPKPAPPTPLNFEFPRRHF